jgi:hypothetical protein
MREVLGPKGDHGHTTAEGTIISVPNPNAGH